MSLCLKPYFTLSIRTHPPIYRSNLNPKQYFTFPFQVITLIFACFTTPPFVLNWIEVLNPQVFVGPYATLAFIAMDISNVLVVLNSSSTFIIYLIYCRKYRHLFMYYSSKCYSRGTTLRKWSEDRLSRRSTAISLTPAADELSGHSFTPERRHRLSYV